MLRRKFIQNLAWLTGGVALTNYAPAKGFEISKKSIKGFVFTNGIGIKDVAVSDGYRIVATDEKGKYTLELHPEAIAIFISTPSGFAFNNKKGIARHYRLLKDVMQKSQ